MRDAHVGICGEHTMSESKAANFRLITAIIAVLAVIAYSGVQTTEPPGKIPQPASASASFAAEPEFSNFVSSGGLVPDSAPTVPSADQAVGHAAVKHAESTEPATF
jgi:hypothetical protein